jgi:hypothetical protein
LKISSKVCLVAWALPARAIIEMRSFATSESATISVMGEDIG